MPGLDTHVSVLGHGLKLLLLLLPLGYTWASLYLDIAYSLELCMRGLYVLGLHLAVHSGIGFRV